MAKVADIVEKAPLSEILDTIEAVAMFIPGLGNVVAIIAKVLRILIKVQPAASKAMHGIVDIQHVTPAEELNKYVSFIPATDNASLNALRTMVDIAIEDGELSDDEISMLTNKASECGLDLDLFVMGLRNALKKN